MDLLFEIRKIFSVIDVNYAQEVEQLEVYTWIIRDVKWYGVAIPNENDIEINERFNNVRLWSNKVLLEERVENVLLLTSTNYNLRYEFAAVCAEFCNNENETREKVTNNPFGWWEKWRNLLGNSVLDKSTYSVLGEMIVLEQLTKRGLDVKWKALDMSTHDIESGAESYEVKSTLTRYGNTITVNSQYQMKNSMNLNVILCRFEESDQGICIDDMIERLGLLGFDGLDDSIEDMGYEKGSHTRKQKYKLLEMRKYNVDDNFPRIIPASFKEEKLPPGIIKITYEVDLTGFPYEKIDII